MLSDSIPTLNSQKLAPDAQDLDSTIDGRVGLTSGVSERVPLVLQGSAGYLDGEDWGIVVSTNATGQATHLTSLNAENNDLDQTGILILPGDEEGEVSEPSAKSSESAAVSGGKVSETDLQGDRAAGESILMARSAGTPRATIPDIAAPEETSSPSRHHDGGLQLTVPDYDAIPSDLESLHDPLDANSNASPGLVGAASRPNEIRIQDVGLQTFVEAFQCGASRFWNTTKETFAEIDSDMPQNSKQVLRLIFLFLSLAVFVSTTSWMLQERRSYRDFNSQLEGRILQLEQELSSSFAKLASVEEGHKEELEKMKDFIDYLHRGNEQLKKQQQQRIRQLEEAEAKAKLHVQQERIEFEVKSSQPLERRACLAGSNNPVFLEAEKNLSSQPQQVLFENCWIQAEAKLGDCAHEARKAFGSKLKTLGQSIWTVQEQVVDKVHDFGKRMQTAAREAAERVVTEAEQHWSSTEQTGSNPSYGRKNQTNFRNFASTIVTSAAFATIATVAVDRAVTYFTEYSTDEEV